MARYDKYEPFGGGFRAPLEADWPAADFNKAVGVGLNANGRIVRGAGATGVLGVIVITSRKRAREIVDTMTDGEIVEFQGGVPGTVYFAQDNGDVNTTNTGTRVGHTVEAARLVVRAAR